MTLFFLLGSLCLHETAAFDWFVDSETPHNARTTLHSDGVTEYTLVFSDEFNQDGRSFADGQDIKWTALDKPDTSNAPQVYYSPDQITTKDGNLVITTSNEPYEWVDFNEDTKKEEKFKRNYRSGMLQGWNKVCFSGGIVEVSLTLPGKADVAGLWPAAWLMGNLGRATYTDSTNDLWPYSYDECNPDDEFKQRISACDVDPGHGMNSRQGRGAPEIDIFESMADPYYSLFTSSLQIAPKLPDKMQPTVGEVPKKGEWYQGLQYGDDSGINVHYYGSPLGDAVSAWKLTHSSMYKEHHTFRLEWVVGAGGGIKWYLDGKFYFEILADSLEATGDGGPQRMMPAEPMYMVLNTAMSTTWSRVCGEDDPSKQTCPPGSMDECCSIFPAEYLVDYVRVYQDPTAKGYGLDCSPDDFPSEEYIKDFAPLYGGELLAVKPPETEAQRDFTSGATKLLGCLLALILVGVALQMGYHRFCHRAKYRPIADSEDVLFADTKIH